MFSSSMVTVQHDATLLECHRQCILALSPLPPSNFSIRPFYTTALHQALNVFNPPDPFSCVRVEILSALRNLQEKIMRLELEKGHAERALHAVGQNVSYAPLQREEVAQRLSGDHREPEREISGESNNNQGGCMNNIVYSPPPVPLISRCLVVLQC